MAHERRYRSQQEEDYHYNQRSHSQGAPNGYYDDTQGNPYAYYSQPQAPPDYGRNGSYHEQPVTRDRDRDRYYARSEDDDSVSILAAVMHLQPCKRLKFREAIV